MKTKLIFAAAFTILMPLTAHAKKNPADLTVNLIGPDNVNVNDGFSMQAIAATEKRVRGVKVKLLYPSNITTTQYSPICYPISGGLECNIGTMSRNSQYTISAEFTAPASAGSTSITAMGTIRGPEADQGNNTSVKTITVLDPTPPPATAITLNLPQNLEFTACWTDPYDGVPGSLNDCQVPASTQQMTLNADGSATTSDPNNDVYWSQSTDETTLTLEGYDPQGVLVVRYTGNGVSTTCFEGTGEFYQAVAEAAWQGCKN